MQNESNNLQKQNLKIKDDVSLLQRTLHTSSCQPFTMDTYILIYVISILQIIVTTMIQFYSVIPTRTRIESN